MSILIVSFYFSTFNTAGRGRFVPNVKGKYLSIKVYKENFF